ncbi:MAG: TIGR00153 family protein [Gemmatimonadetes bacterium]|nr:TIGR00153 family protein [Gemmatimonadota bacterium]
MRTIFELFGKSPFEPLAKHGQIVEEVIQEVRPLVEAFLAQDWSETKEVSDRISRQEHRADQLKAEIRDHLPRSLFLPVDRGDLLRLLKAQDAMADAVEDVAVLITMRQTRVPEKLKPHVLALTDQILQAAKTWFTISKLLPQLQEAAFTGPEVKRVLDLIDTLGEQEWRSDQLGAQLGRESVLLEEELGAISLSFIMRVGQKLGDVPNHAETAGDMVRLMLARG